MTGSAVDPYVGEFAGKAQTQRERKKVFYNFSMNYFSLCFFHGLRFRING